MKEDILNDFDEKFQFRIYGIAGEPKTEFIEPKNLPDRIKSYILSKLTLQEQRHKAEMKEFLISKKKDIELSIQDHTLDFIAEDTLDSKEAFYYGYNQALTDTIKELGL